MKSVAYRPTSAQYFETDHLLDDLHGKAFRGGLVSMSGQAAKFALQLISTVALARLLSPADFGMVAMVASITGFVAAFKDGGLAEATVQRSRITHEQVSLLFWVNCGLSFLTALVVVALSPFIAWFYREPRLVGIAMVSSGAFIFGGFIVQHQALLVRQMRFKTIAAVEIAASACAVTTAIVMAWQNFGYWALVALNVSTYIYGAIFVWWSCGWRPGRIKRLVGARSMIAFGGNLTASGVVNYFTRNFDNILIGRVLGSTAIGVYSKAFALLTLPINQINVPFGDIVVPALSRLQGDSRQFRDFYLRSLRGLCTLVVPIVVMSFFLAEDVVLLLLGPKWSPVARVFQCLAPAALVTAISSAPAWLCISTGRARHLLHSSLVSAPVCVSGFLIGIRWGVTGVALSFSVTLTASFVWFVWYSSKGSFVSVRDTAKTVLSVLIPALSAGAVALLVRRTVLSQTVVFPALVGCGLTFGVVYASFMLAFEGNRAMLWATSRAAFSTIAAWRRPYARSI